MVDAGVVIISETNLGAVLRFAAIVDRIKFRAAELFVNNNYIRTRSLSQGDRRYFYLKARGTKSLELVS